MQEYYRGKTEERGRNVLEDEEKKSWAESFLEQLNDPLIFILFVAAAISLLLREYGDMAIILAVVLLNATVGVIQEGKAKKSLEVLKQMTSPHALLLEGDEVRQIPAADLIPGDLVVLEAGCQVPADLVLTEAVNLKIEESALTGESVPVNKDTAQNRMAYMSTNVTYGRGVGRVSAIGMDTEIGKIAGMLKAAKVELTPLQKRLADLGKILGAVSVFLCVLLFGMAILQKRDVGEMLITAISLAVAAVPEGLPAIVTMVLALSVSRMVKVNAIVKRLPSVETLGCVSVVCSDKTGTLTQNRMTVKKCYVNGRVHAVKELHPAGDRYFLQGFSLCNDASLHGGERRGDPTELALLDMAAAFGIQRETLEDTMPRIDEIAFDSERKRMTTLHETLDGRISFTKGSPDEILERCRYVWSNGKTAAFSAAAREQAKRGLAEMTEAGLRVLAIGMHPKAAQMEESGLTFLGMAGMEDPVRPEAAEAVEQFARAGVRTIMITGDRADTALAIARQLGIAERRDECVTGEEMERMDEQMLAARISRTRVFAHVSPEHKVRIVSACKKNGEIVAMTGDGVNDAPSLKSADVGIAMGMAGTDVARNAADMVLADDNFATIAGAIAQGRSIYENIRKSVLFLLSSNFGEIITMLAAVAMGLASPLKSSHILWINLITDSLPALALGMDGNDGEELMKQPPRKSTDTMFSHGGLSCTLCFGVVIGVISILAFMAVPYEELLQRQLPVNLSSMKKILEIEWILNKAQTHAFTVLGMSQLVHAVGMRDVNRSVFRMKHFENLYMLAALGIGLLLQVLVTEVPYLITLFETNRLTLGEWGRLQILSLTPLAVHELLCLFTAAGQKQVRAEEVH